MKKTLIISACLLPLLGAMTSCEKKGPAEEIGEKMDKAADNVKDAVDPKGPAEKAGEKIDNATGR